MQLILRTNDASFLFWIVNALCSQLDKNDYDRTADELSETASGANPHSVVTPRGSQRISALLVSGGDYHQSVTIFTLHLTYISAGDFFY